MRCFTLAWSKCISWMFREIGPPEIQNALHLLHKVFSLICTLITKYHFILSNLQRHNRQLGYWWSAWSRWMIWTSYSEPRRIGSAANITLEDLLRIKNSNAYWKAWRMKHRGLKTEGRERFQLNPQGEKKCLKMCHELEKPFSDGECFLAENNLNAMPPLAGHYWLRNLSGVSLAK